MKYKIIINLIIIIFYYYYNFIKKKKKKKSLPTMFLSECVMIYMDPMDSDAIVKWISDNVPTAMILAYEQILPNDAFGQMMIKNLKVNTININIINQICHRLIYIYIYIY